ncbi:MAG: hypothetical protein JXD21_04855 [Candidatus Omnitrophica bacterium]|nr:hypothetical protein [Candidatus Omnitrophota bacterium]
MKRSFILLATIVTTLFLGIFIGISGLRMLGHMRSTTSRELSQDALYVAEAGVEKAVFELRSNIDWIGEVAVGDPIPGFEQVEVRLDRNDPQTAVGYYTIKLGKEPYSDAAWIIIPLRIEGRSAHPSQEAVRILDVEIRAQSPSAFFVFTLGDIHVGSGANIGSNMLGRDIYLEVSDTVPPEMQGISVDGDVVYLRNLIGDLNDPAIQISGEVYQGDPVTFVGVDISRYRNIAQNGGAYIDGDFRYQGNINRQELNAPNGVVFINGDVEIEGNVTEPMLIVAGGDIHIIGDVEYQANGSHIQLGLFSGNDIVIDETAPGIDGDLALEALVIADGGVLRAEGGKGTQGTLDFKGAISVRGAEGVRTVIDLNVFRQRNYEYDQMLFLDPQIPFMSYIADLRKWEVVGSPDVFTSEQR